MTVIDGIQIQGIKASCHTQVRFILTLPVIGDTVEAFVDVDTNLEFVNGDPVLRIDFNPVTRTINDHYLRKHDRRGKKAYMNQLNMGDH